MFGQKPTLLEAATVTELLQKAQQFTIKNGHASQDTANPEINCHAATLTLTIDFQTNEKGRYPYWDKSSENWYLKTFVTSKIPPELIRNADMIFPYTYGWRSQFYDEGWGYILQTIKLLKENGYENLTISHAEDLAKLVSLTYTSIHPNVLLSVLAWQGEKNMHTFLTNISFVEHQLTSHRINTIKHVSDHLQEQPNSSFAITPSLTYGAFDHIHLTSHAPAYQTFQALTILNKDINAPSLETIHHQKSMYVDGSGQLDIAHDLLWGQFLSQRTGMSHTKLTIFVNELKFSSANTSTATSIEQALLASVNGYQPRNFDLSTFLESPSFRHKAQVTLEAYLHAKHAA